MTRFARAKGSKASNERLPEQATPWGELKEQLFKKNQEKDNKEAQEKAFEQRNANYKAFLKEREEEEAKNMSWAQFPGNDSIESLGNKRTHSQVDSAGNKSKKINSHLEDNQGEPTSETPKTKKLKKTHKTLKNEQNTPDFNDLKNKLDKVLDSPTFKESKYDSDNDAPPDEASAKDKPQEIVTKKAKVKKPLLKIVQNRQERFDNYPTEINSDVSNKNNGKKQGKLSKNNKKNKQKIETQQGLEELSEKSLSKIQKKKERYQKQLEKKKLKKSEQKTDNNDEENKQDRFENQNDNDHNLSTSDKEQNITQGDDKISEKSLHIIQKKKEKRQKQLEKKKLKKMEQKTENEAHKNGEESLQNSEKVASDKSNKKKGPIQPEYDNENLTEKDLLRIKKKKERRARQKEKRQQLREMKHQQQGLTNERNNKIKNESSGEDKKKQNVENEKVDKKNLTAEDLAKIKKKKEKLARQAEKRKKFKEEKLKQQQESSNNNNNDEEIKDEKPKLLPKKDFGIKNGFKTEFKTNPAKKKFRDDKEHQRRKPIKPEKMVINGKEVEIDYIDSFPVKKEDADRIRQLRKDMINKGLPRSEIDVALKLERRRAEKALAREKKNVCFNCRKSGHNLSECPELGSSSQMIQSSGTGICFKCGSTEHTHFECRVEKGDVYKYASCFICNEQGHIAKQCPDNQRGLYPKGGSCKVCGDVTHLKKDCPKYHAQQQHLQSSLNVSTMDNSNPDLIDGGSSKQSWGIKGRVEVKRPNKVVKF